ncbi:MAG: TlyA family RNA methyltransferase [Clostridiales bacterium]|jgi:23S rRNA (cytidine1920-2'-O)/16S rRNA (cytidine1409-2'-O)-methyltransferase|nr:TlyA family RNA methyltransferase [Clostridiales bacterium]
MTRASRLDAYLAEHGFYESRRIAREAIQSGLVKVGGRTVTKPAARVPELPALPEAKQAERAAATGQAEQAERAAEAAQPAAAPQPGRAGQAAKSPRAPLQDGGPPLIEAAPFAARYVSRGGDKLASALDAFGIGVAGAVALDVGASTGGFTDCLLQRGAAFVYAIDAGSGQLSAKLASHPRVMLLEKTNARYLRPRAVNGGRCGLAVIDVSFISLEKILLPVSAQLLPGADIVCLVKPQFEVGPANVGKNGIVKDAALHAEAIGRVELYARSIGLSPAGRSESPILGGDGNREFFLWIK